MINLLYNSLNGNILYKDCINNLKDFYKTHYTENNKFTFTISFNNVYNDGIKELGHLYDDCHGVPMLKTGVEWKKLPLFLDSSPELRNIYFEVLNDEWRADVWNFSSIFWKKIL